MIFIVVSEIPVSFDDAKNDDVEEDDQYDIPSTHDYVETGNSSAVHNIDENLCGKITVILTLFVQCSFLINFEQ